MQAKGRRRRLLAALKNLHGLALLASQEGLEVTRAPCNPARAQLQRLRQMAVTHPAPNGHLCYAKHVAYLFFAQQVQG